MNYINNISRLYANELLPAHHILNVRVPLSTIIVIGFDSKYFDLGVELIRSIRVHRDLDVFNIAVLDLGLGTEHKEFLIKCNVYIKTAIWNLDFPNRAHYDEHEPGFRGMVARPFLPEYFPEYDNIFWIDADTWVQSSEAILEMERMLSYYDCCAVPEIDRSYVKFNTLPNAWQSEANSYDDSFDESEASFLRLMPQINTGVLAMRKDCPHWTLWQHYLEMGLRDGCKNRVVEQHAFNLAVYKHDLNIAKFPSRYNWIIGLSTPYYCFEGNYFVEPSPPHAKISILHMTCVAIDKIDEINVMSRDGRKLYKIPKSGFEYQYWENKVHRYLG